VACEPLLLGGRIDGDVAGGKVRFMHDVVPTSSLLVPSTLTPAGRWLLSVVALAALSACSSLRGPTTAPPPPLLGAPTSTPSPPPSSVPAAPSAIPLGAPSAVSPGTPAAPAFDSVIKGADVQAGLMPVWRRQDKVWIELAPTDFGRALFLSPKLVTGVGESGLLGGLLGSRWAQVGRPQWVEFRRVHNQVQLVARNAAYRATPDTPQAQAVSAAFSPSLLASVPVASAPHPQRQTVLVELSALMTGDLLGLGAQLQRAYRQSYSLDARNTQIQQTQGTPGAMVVQVQQHFATASLASPGTGAGPQPAAPSTLPDPRSLFLTVQYTLTALPDPPMPTRRADARVGYFATTIADFSDDLARTPRQRFINRWRLDKQDPKAALSPPVRPIVFWLDGSIPKDYRGAITEGVLAWNRAFEAIGFKDAIQVRDDPARQPLDIVASGQAIIRWMTNASPSFGAIGPVHVDPRTGEILTADIALESLSSRAIRAARSQILDTSSSAPALAPDACQHGDMAAEQLAYGLDVLADRAGLPPDAPLVRDFVLAYLRDTTMHEVGHTLGLRHNFRASRWRSLADTQDATLTQRDGLVASVMEYNPINLPLPGQTGGAPFQTTLGPYDLWAIEYGYAPLEGEATAQAAALQAIARRQAEPRWQAALDFGTDEDHLLGLDPQALPFDLGNDPVAFARQRVAIARDLIERQGRVQLGPDDEPALIRRRIAYALRDLERTAGILSRQVGGLITRRDGADSPRALLEPLPAAAQREALQLLLDTFLTPGSLRIPPAVQRRLAPDYFERAEGVTDATGQPIQTDFPVAVQLMRLQREVLNQLMNDTLAERMLDNIDKSRDLEPSPLTVRELHRRVREAVWTAGASDEAAPWRRNLQRDHVNRVAAGVLRGSARADVRAQWLQQARILIEQLRRPTGQSADSTAEAHRRDCLATLERALSAQFTRVTP